MPASQAITPMPDGCSPKWLLPKSEIEGDLSRGIGTQNTLHRLALSQQRLLCNSGATVWLGPDS